MMFSNSKYLKNPETEPQNTAKVPLMITIDQKQYLREVLNYKDHQIKSLTPQEAKRIIDYSIDAQDYKS
jgi:hypothetical protein